MNNKENYFKNHPWYNDSDIETNNRSMIKKYISDLDNQWVDISNSLNILEIWFWIWNFAAFCNFKSIKNYTWVDIDSHYWEELKKIFSNYIFLKDSFQNFLLKKENQYDLIFTSHIVEHLEKKELFELIRLINKSLRKGWKWINYMPNANSTVNALNMRYCDITHINFYNNQSFEQAIINSWVIFNNIYHLNDRPTTFIKRIIYSFFLFLTKIYYLWMMQILPAYNSINLISIIEK